MNFTLQIGNSDNKLTQQEWSKIIKEIENLLTIYHAQRYFTGGSDCKEAWQNYCWCFDLEGSEFLIKAFKEQLRRCRERYLQDSVAILQGTSEFI
jgi:hypothetical protein